MRPVSVRERPLRSGGIRTVLRESGLPESSEAVVFCHGNPGPSDEWTGLMARIGTFARAVAWDAPGFGQADKPSDFPHTVAGHAGFIGTVLDDLRINRVHLVAHDFGMWGLRWAADHPERFASAVLINTGVLFGYRWHWLARIWQTPLLGELMMATSSRGVARLIMRRTNPRLSLETIDRLFDSSSEAGTRRAVLRLYRASKQQRLAASTQALSARLRPLDRPALVVWGAQDPFVPIRYAETNRRTFPGAEIAIIQGSGHWPLLDNPAIVETRIVDFLQRAVIKRSRPLSDQAGVDRTDGPGDTPPPG